MNLRIGVLDIGGPGWAGGATFVQVLLHALAASGESDVTVFTDDDAFPDRVGDLQVERLPFTTAGSMGISRLVPSSLDRARSVVGLAERGLRRILGRSVFDVARRRGISVLLPALALPERGLIPPTIAWVPDFQHRHLPDYFSADEIANRERTISNLIRRASRILLSSESVGRDLSTFYEVPVDRTAVLRFPSRFAFETPPPKSSEVIAKFHLPAKFALVINQFWRHKNHACVVRAVAVTRDRGIDTPVVMAGLPADYRDPANATVSSVLQEVASQGVHDRVVLLGRVSYPDLIDLMRSAAAIVQPSRFEGWNTGLQDALALGRPVICSDLAVHREQAPSALGFFSPDRPDQLADVLSNHWGQLSAGPDVHGESEALARARAAALRYSKELRRLCEDVARGQ